jgi:3-deoxy-manno-octulosonate cytidylyltransferase (CMP-KDO synthetase)
MILWVAELSAKAVGRDNVFVATEDQRIVKTVEKAGFQAVLTSDDALTGTDRLAEAATQIDADIYINVQGDEPLADPADILKVRDAKMVNINDIVNGFSWVSETEDAHSVNIPKVITNEKNRLVYMSRVALPGFKDKKCAPKFYKKQVCIYAFNKQELKAFQGFGRKSELENAEDIEILRFLELGKAVQMIETKAGSLAVDVPEDVKRVEKALQDAGQGLA